jgi:uncharacterized damage-inducible protein DinB
MSAVFLKDHIVSMARNNAWANHRLLKACEALSEEEFAAKRTSFFPSIRATLNHNLVVDWYYIDAMTAENALRHYTQPDPDYANAADLRKVQTESDKKLIAFCARQTDKTLTAEIILPRPDRKPPPCQIHTILAHLFQHQIHHRGQAHAMLAGTKVKPPQLDEFFLSGELELRRAELKELGLPEV